MCCLKIREKIILVNLNQTVINWEISLLVIQKKKVDEQASTKLNLYGLARE